MKTRASNIELLRIVSMMMIMVLHFVGHALKIDVPVGTTEWALWNANKVLTISATSIFVLISGYWGIRFSFRKLLSLYLQCFIWGLVGYVLYVLCSDNPLKISTLIGRLFAFTHNKMWFVDTYLELMFLAPLLNAAIDFFNKKQHLSFIVLFACVTLYMGYCHETGEDTWGTSLSHFLWLYMIARYINKYVDLSFIRRYRWCWLGGFVGMSVITFVLAIFEAKYAVPCCLRPYPYCSPWTTLAAISALLFALSFTFESKIVNWFASSSLSCYLFQDGLYFGTWMMYPAIGAWLMTLPMLGRYAILFPLALAFMIPVMLVDKLWGVVLYKPVLNIYDKLYDRFVPQSFKKVF